MDLDAADRVLDLHQQGQQVAARQAAADLFARLAPDWLEREPAIFVHRVALILALVLNREEQARALFAAAHEKAPEEPEYRVACAVSLCKAGERETAAMMVEGLASVWVGLPHELNAEEARLLAQAAHILSELDPDFAQRCMRKCLEAAPESPQILRIAGALALSAGDYDDAETHFRRAVDLAPDWDALWGGLHASYLGLGWCEEAVELGRDALRRWPGFADLRFNQAAACLNLRWFGEADRELEGYLAEVGDDALATACLGLSYALQGREGEARQQQRLALELDESDAEVKRVSREIDKLLGGGGAGEEQQKAVALILWAVLARQGQRRGRCA